MGAILQIAGQIFSRILIAFLAWAFTFTGQTFDAKLIQSTTTPKLNTSPIFVEIKNSNVDIEKTKIIATKKAPIVVPKKNTTQTQAPIIKTETKETPSLTNLPVPSLELPQISDEINRGITLGEWNTTYINSKQSIVNIFCISTKGNMVSISTGSGVIISEQGIILTNSHVAENFLVPGKDCSIRQGEIALDKYKASLIYINEKWLEKNAGLLFSQGARGTGENDFALLSIISKNDGSTIDSNIPHVNINTTELTEQNIGNKILIAGYPASTLGILSLQKYLNFVADVISISNVFTLDGTHVDVFETGVTKVGQHGSSGGGIFDASNNLTGLIVSVSDESGNAKLNAITTTYISRTLKNEIGKSLEEFLNTDKNLLLSSFLLKQKSLFEYVRPYIQ